MRDLLGRIFLGRRKDFKDPGIFHRMALVPFLAWVGLGADGLSSSSYGPEEAFRALGEHRYLAVGLALATALTVVIISASYSQIIKHFPYGGGGYVVASQLLGDKVGVISGSALLIDYILTITISVASGADAVFSFLPWWAHYKMPVEFVVICLLVLVNLRGVKESVVALMPIFLLFLFTHAIVIGWGIASHVGESRAVAHQVSEGFKVGLGQLGGFGMLLLFLKAYSLGGGTYTGIEAVSNGLAIMREPKVETGRRTMLYMAVSLAITAGGILFCYLLWNVVPDMNPDPEKRKTMNALLLGAIAGHWHIGGFSIGNVFVVVTLVTEAMLLFVAAQAGFIDGPRVMSNMAHDSWLPHRFAALSDRLTTQNGVMLMGSAAIGALWYTHGKVSDLVVMYSINVFLTFSLSQLGMLRFWLDERKQGRPWKKDMPINVIGFVLCLAILVVTVLEKFAVGGWVTVALTAVLVALCVLIRNHYRRVTLGLSYLDDLFSEIHTDPKKEELGPVDPKRATAAVLVSSYGGLGVHTVLSLLKMFPHQFTNLVFISVGVVDSANLKGAKEVEVLKRQTKDALGKYVGLGRRLGFSSDFRMSIGTEVVDEAARLCNEVAQEFPHTTFFSGTLIFEEPHWYHKVLHNETAYAIQHRLQFAGHPMVILPVRVRTKQLEARPLNVTKEIA